MLSKFIKSIFTITFTEKDAIRGNSVDQYRYANQLLKHGNNENLIKAYSWLSLASDDVYSKLEASRVMRQVEYELKSVDCGILLLKMKEFTDLNIRVKLYGKI